MNCRIIKNDLRKKERKKEGILLKYKYKLSAKINIM
jgi:hypothetical protein